MSGHNVRQRGGSRLTHRNKGLTGPIVNDAISVTLIARHYRALESLMLPRLYQRLRPFVLCDGNCAEAGFRLGCSAPDVNYAAKAAMREIAKLRKVVP